MVVNNVRRIGAGAVLAAGAAIAAAAVAHADTGTEEINGWTVQNGPLTTTAPGLPGEVAQSATLLDPTDSLGLGKEVSGIWADNTMFGLIKESVFTSRDDAGAQPSSLSVADISALGSYESIVTVTHGSGLGATVDETQGRFIPTLDGKSLVNLIDERPVLTTAGFAPALLNPDATGPVTVDGLPVASPQDGSLYGDIFGALFKGETAGWGAAATLVDDLLGIDPSGTADAAGVLPDFSL